MELVTVTTSDYVRLHGAYTVSQVRLRPAASTSSHGSVDAAVLVHGIGGNFYSSRLLNHVAATLQELGISTVLINTRGHEMVNTLSWNGRARSGGSALENVDECRFDLNAWHDFLIDRGHTNVLFLGHSLGAIKSIYCGAYAPPARLRAIIALSPSRLSYQQMLKTSRDGLFAATFAECQQRIAEGRGAEPIPVKYPVATWMTPDCYVDKYGPDEKFNWLNFIHRVTIPSLLVFGEQELAQHPAFIGLEAELESAMRNSPHLQVETIPHADHFYSSKFAMVDDRIFVWLAR
jgi:pimeloyl-ACP methyl ester carboxylesterase